MPNDIITIELNWNVPNNECIKIKLNKEQSKQYRKFVKEYGFDIQIFSDYEDE
jgi:hypothetical protein